jgi:Skp family chaperone for outer membrane proteins
MRTHLAAAAIFCCSAVGGLSRGVAQQPAAQSGAQAANGVLVAVIDIGYVLTHHAVLQQRLEKIKAEVKAFDSQLTERRRQITAKTDQLTKLPPGNPEYRKLEEELTRDVSALQVEAQLKKKEMLNQEATSYYEAYNEVLGTVDAVASRYGIGLVLRFDRENIDPTDRTSVLRGVNRAVVFQRNLDISPLVVEHLQAASRQLSNVQDGPSVRRR